MKLYECEAMEVFLVIFWIKKKIKQRCKSSACFVHSDLCLLQTRLTKIKISFIPSSMFSFQILVSLFLSLFCTILVLEFSFEATLVAAQSNFTNSSNFTSSSLNSESSSTESLMTSSTTEIEAVTSSTPTQMNVTATTTTTTTRFSPHTTTTAIPVTQFSRSDMLDITLLVAAGFAALCPHVPIASFIVSRASAVSRIITPLNILESTLANETASCTSFGFRHRFDEDAPLFFDSPILEWNLSPSSSKSTSSVSYCFGYLIATLVGNLCVGLGCAAVIYLINFLILCVRFHSLPSSPIEPAANGWVSRFLIIYFYGFLFPGAVSSMLISASRCAHGFSGAIAAVIVFIACFAMYAFLFWRKRNEEFRYRLLTFESAKSLNKLQLWILYLCEPRGIWRWIHHEERGKPEKAKQSIAEQQQQNDPPQKLEISSTAKHERPVLSQSFATVTSPTKQKIGAGGSTIATILNSHSSLPTFGKNIDDYEARRKRSSSTITTTEVAKESESKVEPIQSSASPTTMPLEEQYSSDSSSPSSSSSDDSSSDSDQDERENQKRNQGKKKESSKKRKGNEKNKKKNKKTKQKKAKEESKKKKQTDSSDDEDDEMNPIKREQNSQLRYLVALPYFDLYAGRENFAFILAELGVRIIMIAALVIAESVPPIASCYTLRGGYMLASLLLSGLTLIKSPHAHRLVFYAVVISTACEAAVELLLLVDPFTGAELGPPILMASMILSVMILCFVVQIYMTIAPIVWRDLQFLEYKKDPFAPPKKQKPPPPPAAAPVSKTPEIESKDKNNTKKSEQSQRPVETEQDLDELLGTKPAPKPSRTLKDESVNESFNSVPLLLLQNNKPSADADSDLDLVNNDSNINKTRQRDNDDTDSDDDDSILPPPPRTGEMKKLEFSDDSSSSSSDDDDDSSPTGLSTGAATTTITSYVFYHHNKKEEDLDLFERLDKRVRKAFFDLYHEDVHLLPRHHQLQKAKDDFEQLVDL